MKLYEMLDAYMEISELMKAKFEDLEDGVGTPLSTYVLDYTADVSFPLNAMTGPVVDYILYMIQKWGVPDDLDYAIGTLEC